MADVFSKDKRSEIMKGVRSSGNKSTELKLIQYFSSNHITGWRRKYNVKGHPDFVFLDKRIAIFVDGCFWHGHDCRIPDRLRMQSTGKRRELGTLNTIKLLRTFLKDAAGP